VASLEHDTSKKNDIKKYFLKIHSKKMIQMRILNEKKFITNSYLFVLILFLFVFNSCNKVTPAGFWKNYEQDKITNSTSDQGPWGGQRIIKWLNKEAFNTKEINEFATKNGWKLIDSLTINKATKSKFDIFKNEYSEQIFTTKVLPNIKTETIIYIYKTGWIAVKPGNTDETEINGFVTLSSDKTELDVYHIWGE
jgi:hypothetical protein